ncbi:hypothetical protein ES703_54797 [subsurface metagenome]
MNPDDFHYNESNMRYNFRVQIGNIHHHCSQHLVLTKGTDSLPQNRQCSPGIIFASIRLYVMQSSPYLQHYIIMNYKISKYKSHPLSYEMHTSINHET